MNTGPVIVGTDLGGAAGEAVRQAAKWANAIGAPLLVVHVAPDEVFQVLETPKVADALRQRVKDLVRPLELSFDVALEAGSAHAALVRISDERHAELAVIGASGASAVERALFGSTAAQVVRYARCPVLVARPSPETGIVLAATDFSEAAEHAVDVAAKEAKRRGVELRLVHVLYDPASSLSLLGPILISAPEIPNAGREELRDAAGETLKTSLQNTHATGTYQVLTGPPAQAIADEATRVGAGLVVVATRGRTGFARIALGSVAEAVVRQAPCSVLAVRGERARQSE